MISFLKTLPKRYGRVTQSGTYVPQIDGLRFLAIAVVIFYHATFRGERAVLPAGELQQGWLAYLPNGAAGVELFFFISGYIIAFPFLSSSMVSLKNFYLRRLTRLEPPYFLVLILCFLILTVAIDKVGQAPQFAKSDVSIFQSFLASCFYLHGLLFQAPPRLNPPFWSLEIEIQFYLIAPFLLLAYKRLGPQTRRMTVGLLLAAFLLVLQVTLPREWLFMRYTVICNGYAFILGIVMCDYAVSARPFSQAPDRRFDVVFFAGFAIFMLSAITWLPWAQTVETGMMNLCLRAIGILLLYIGLARGSLSRRILGNAWLALIGGACYSIYLVHVPLMQVTGNIAFGIFKPDSVIAAMLIALVTLVPASIIAGMVFYVLVERPCMKHDWPQRLIRRLRLSTVERPSS